MRVAEGGSRGEGKWAICYMVLKIKMRMKEQNVECVDWLFSTIIDYANSGVLL